MAEELLVTLIRIVDKGTDEDGNPVLAEEPTEVYARKTGIGQREFFSAGQQGLRPSFCLRVFRYDYDGQQEAEVEGRRYKIYRTYIDDRHNRRRGYLGTEEIELYCERRLSDGP